MTNPPVAHLAGLEPDQVREVLALAATAGDADGSYPFSEDAVLRLRRGAAPADHLLIHVDGRLAGYAYLDPSDPAQGPGAEVVVHPLLRRRGLGRALLTAVIDTATTRDPAGRLRLWAHGDHPSASALALALGFDRYRVLYRMRRPLDAPVAVPEPPRDVRIRAFRPGLDEAAWVALNARAFVHHPEQGRWTVDDLRMRMAEPWFDPAGFLLAERVETGPDGPELLGFHWTKVHDAPEPSGAKTPGPSGGAVDGRRPDPIGEVYVLGVDPGAQGLGLGSLLTLSGLRYLRDRGLDRVMLYVDGDDPGPVHLYEKLGFARWAVDAGFRRRVDGGAA